MNKFWSIFIGNIKNNPVIYVILSCGIPKTTQKFHALFTQIRINANKMAYMGMFFKIVNVPLWGIKYFWLLCMKTHDYEGLPPAFLADFPLLFTPPHLSCPALWDEGVMISNW